MFAPAASKDLAAIYAAILDELRRQYVLGYVSDNLKAGRQVPHPQRPLQADGAQGPPPAGLPGPQDPTPPRQAAKR